MSIPRLYVDGLSRVEPDQRTGMVKLTFEVQEPGGAEDALQVVIHVESLNKMFQKVSEKMQATFGGGGPGGPGGMPPGKRGGRPPKKGQSNLRDLTQY